MSSANPTIAPVMSQKRLWALLCFWGLHARIKFMSSRTRGLEEGSVFGVDDKLIFHAVRCDRGGRLLGSWAMMLFGAVFNL